jgi:hypothetical protein
MYFVTPFSTYEAKTFKTAPSMLLLADMASSFLRLIGQ